MEIRMNILPLGLAGIPQDAGLGPLKREYGIPPFSTWDTRQEDWQSRRRLWMARGIRSEEGRKDGMTFMVPEFLKDGRPGATRKKGGEVAPQTSVFDPVICELAMRWWCPAGGVVLDPFAGGSVRGVVASLLGLRYWGCELRAEQVEANKAQAASPMLHGQYKPVWVQGDSKQVLAGSLGRLPPSADMLFSCPPYGNLEVYSDDPADISNRATFAEFLNPYRVIIRQAVDLLRQDRFAVWVVANYRDERGMMLDFVGATVKAFEDAGCRYYNDIVLINSVGTGALRGRRTFGAAGKVIKLHQNVLVFVKGDPKVAMSLCKQETESAQSDA